MNRIAITVWLHSSWWALKQIVWRIWKDTLFLMCVYYLCITMTWHGQTLPASGLAEYSRAIGSIGWKFSDRKERFFFQRRIKESVLEVCFWHVSLRFEPFEKVKSCWVSKDNQLLFRKNCYAKTPMSPITSSKIVLVLNNKARRSKTDRFEMKLPMLFLLLTAFAASKPENWDW